MLRESEDSAAGYLRWREHIIEEAIQVESRNSRTWLAINGGKCAANNKSSILRLNLAAQPAPFGSARWIIVNASATEGVPIT